jgi:hypothetical protein
MESVVACAARGEPIGRGVSSAERVKANRKRCYSCSAKWANKKRSHWCSTRWVTGRGVTSAARGGSQEEESLEQHEVGHRKRSH